MTGLLVLLVAVLATALLGVLYSRWNGRFRAQQPTASTAEESAPVDDRDVLQPHDIGADLGERLTLVQFSSAFCSPCRATRTLLADVTSDRPDVAHVEVDAESNLDLVRRLDIRRTPTVVVLDATGTVVGRASGLPKREQVEAVVGSSSDRSKGPPQV